MDLRFSAERLKLGPEALSDAAVDEEVDGGVDDNEQVAGTQHDVERHRHVEPET